MYGVHVGAIGEVPGAFREEALPQGEEAGLRRFGADPAESSCQNQAGRRKDPHEETPPGEQAQV